MALLSLIWMLNMTTATAPSQEECPCIKAARELGVKGEQFDRFKELCGKLAADLVDVDESAEIKNLGQEMEAAAKAGDDRKKKALGIEQAKRYKPRVRKFHEDVKAMFDADLYRAFSKKLPPFYQPFPETLRGPGMVVEYLRYKVPAAEQKRFLEGWRRSLVILGQSPHCLGYECTQSLDDPEAFIVRLDWDSVDRKCADVPAAAEGIRGFSSFLSAESTRHRIVDRPN